MMYLNDEKNEFGFTLLEVLVAMVVLSIGIFALYSMQTTSINGNIHSSQLTQASNWSADQIERIIGLQLTDPALQDVNGDGTGKDFNDDGIDDNGANFGLDNNTLVTADGNAQSLDNKYTIFWNVAQDIPMIGMKTIRVIVQSNAQVAQAQAAPVVFTYIRSSFF